MRTIWFILSQLALINAAYCSPKADTVFIANDKKIEVGRELVYYTDSTNSLLPEEVLSRIVQGKVNKPSAPNPNFGISNATYWAYLIINNPTESSIEEFIHIDNFLMDTTRCFEVNNQGRLIFVGEAGDYLPFGVRIIQNRNIVYPITLKANQTKTYMVSVYKDQSSISLPIKLWPQQLFYKNDIRETVVYGLYFGILLLVLFYSLFLYANSRRTLLLYYFLYVLILVLFQLNHLGFAQQFLWPNSMFMSNFGFWILGIYMTVFFILFTLSFTQLKKVQPLLYVYFKFIAAILVVFSVFILLLSSNLHEYASVAKKLYYYIQISSALGFILIIIFILKSGSTEGKYFSVAFAALLGFGIVYMLRELGWLGYNGFTQNALIIGSLIEVLVFSLGITHIINKAFIDRQQLSEKIQKQQEEVMIATIETEEKERQRISAELHDSVGSQLSFLKVSLEQLGWFKNKQDLESQVDDIAETVRHISHNMTPIVLEMEGLKVAISNMVEKLNISSQTSFRVEWFYVPDEIPNLKALTLYRVVQEALTNIIKHSNAKEAFINFTGYKNEIVVVIEDDGQGFNKSSMKGIGLKTMKNRVLQFKGKFDLSSNVGNGTSIVITFPI